ncbi:hypothetical protein CEXT_736401 [Caerostris extrusa]|uniref:Uncharacterized protein n=1 Tax=Caerostris extrusa TaxID=172846 RepID=A0AAV4NJU9_CAEEX|nr:hypothetical protein CEXT_736401 [Caerostris extrusa]
MLVATSKNSEIPDVLKINLYIKRAYKENLREEESNLRGAAERRRALSLHPGLGEKGERSGFELPSGGKVNLQRRFRYLPLGCDVTLVAPHKKHIIVLLINKAFHFT